MFSQNQNNTDFPSVVNGLYKQNMYATEYMYSFPHICYPNRKINELSLDLRCFQRSNKSWTTW